MTFKQAVEGTPEIADAWKAGLQALPAVDRQRIDVRKTRSLSGSVNLDSTLRSNYPSESRWDYGVGYRTGGRNGETVYWVEVHPATSGDVSVVLRKLDWLKQWLHDKAPKLNGMRKEFVWISSGKTSFTSSSPQAKRIAAHGFRHSGGRLRIP